MALGRGLESLIPPKRGQASELSDQPSSKSPPGRKKDRIHPERSAEGAESRRENIFYIELDKIKPNPHQPRQDFDEESLTDLATSIARHGIIQPLVVTKHEIESGYGTRVEYHIVAGERRWRAAKLAGFRQVPVIIRTADEQNKLELAITENVQRSDLNPIEEAQAYQKLANDFSLTQEQIAERVVKSREAVANKIRLLSLPYDVQRLVIDKKITEGHAKVLLSLKNPEKQIYLAAQAVKKNWPVRTLEEKIRVETEPRPAKVSPQLDPELEEYKRTIQETLGAPVDISGSRQKGKLAISFYSQEELRRIIEKLTCSN